MLRVVRSPEFNPTLPRSGSAGEYLFRLSNMLKRGRGASSYWETSAGPQNLSETIPTSTLTGTWALTADSDTLAGTGTAATTELRPGQSFLVLDAANSRSFYFVVKRIASATSIRVCRAPSATVSGLTGYRLPTIFAVDKQRGTAIRGNAVRYDKGTIFSVGDGTLRLDGSALTGSSLAMTKDPKVSLYDNTTGNYTNYTLGMPTPAAPVLAAVAGGTKGMQAASYSIVITAERKETLGFNNPSPRADVTIAAGEKIRIPFAAMDAGSGQTAWGVWGTRYSDSLVSDKNYLNGPWFKVRQVTNADVSSAGGNFDVEWLDAEIEANELITFDNDAPPDADFVAVLNGVPVWVGCSGPGDTSPGPFIFPAKPGNIEAAPANIAYPTSPPEIIVGVVSALGRLYLLTTNHLQIAQGTPSEDVPVLIRPFWKAGFDHAQQLVFVNGVLYACTTSGPSRSAADGDEQEAEQTWAAALDEYTVDWVTGHVFVAHDPENDAVCYFHSAYSLNASGFWTTRVWVWGLDQQEWIGDLLLTSTTRDSVVSGVATVGNNLEFLMGGRKADNTVEVGTYRFEGGSGSSVEYFMAPAFSDSGEELRPKRLGPGFRVTGKVTSGSLKVYGAKPTQAVPVSDLEAGTNALATIPLSNNSNVIEGARLQANVRGVGQWTVRVSGTYSGTGARDRIEEVVVENSVEGSRR